MDSILRSLTSGAKFKNKSKRKLGDILSADSKRGERSHAQTSSINLFNSGKTSGNSSDSDDSDSDSDTVKSSNSDNDSVSRTPNLTADSSTEDINAFRNRLQIKVKGSGVPTPIVQFNDAALPSETLSVIMRNIEASDWKEPTPIQMQAIPVLTGGRDLLASAPTGSGKTAAFVIPALGLLSSSASGGSGGGIKVLLLAPTRELAEQIHREAERLSAGRRFRLGIVKKSTASSSALEGQNNHAYSKYDLLVATPMRLVGLLRAKALDLSRVRLVVLDEADKLFEQDSGADHLTAEQEEALGPEGVQSRSSFLSQVDEILAECGTAYAVAKASYIDEKKKEKKGKKRRKIAEGEEEVVTLQRALFSATIGPFVQELAASFLHNPVEVNIGVVNAGATSIDQRLVFVGREDGKLLAIRQLIQQGELKPPVLLFLQNKERAKELFRELVYEGINIDVIHGDRSQQQREDVIRKFRLGETWVLICTDLMARGIDFKGVKMVINYDLPQSGVAYIHRIGRTGRAGRQGEAITLFTEKDIPSMRSIANVMKLSGCKVPDWLLAVKQLKTKEKRQLRKHAPERNSISTVSKYDKQKHSKKMQIISQSKKKKQRATASKA